MERRQFAALASGAGLWGLWSQAALAAALTEGDAAAAVRLALERGAVVAVGLLGRANGFLANPKVKIQLPGSMNSAAKLLRSAGQGRQIDELVVAMNRAAEAAVPESQALLVNAAKSMSVDDGLKIVRGGDTSVTDYFSHKTRDPLSVKFLPIVTQATERVSLAEKYNALAGKAAGMGLMKKQDANIQQYVAGRALDGLYLMIGEEEKKLRRDPIGSGSAILKKVFGA